MAKEKTTAAKAAKPVADEFDKILDGLEKQFGDGNLFNGDAALLRDKRIQLSAPRLSWVFGGTFKMNGIHRFNGMESSGKTTMATILAGECQRAIYEETGDWSNCHVVVLDNERTFDVSHAKDLGLLLVNPDNGKPLTHVLRNLYVDDQEVAFEKMVVSGKVCACIYDSDAAGIDKTAFGEVGYEDISKATFGSGAGANGKVIKRMNYFVDRYQCPVFWISQERANQNPQAHLNALTGGFAVNFYPSTRFRVTAREPIVVKGEIVGTRIKLKNYKNKTGQPFRECFVDVYYRDGDGFKAGMDGEGQYLDMLLELGLIRQAGAWYYYNEDDPDEARRGKGQGWTGIKQWFADHPDMFEEAKELVKAKMSGYDATLDKNSVETSELEDIKAETIAENERKAKASLKLSEEAAVAATTEELVNSTPSDLATEATETVATPAEGTVDNFYAAKG